MRIKIHQMVFGGVLLSWGIVAQSIGRSLIKMGHDVEFISTDGVQDKCVPDDLRDHIRDKPTGNYLLQLSYTAPHNFPRYLAHGAKNRFGIWNLDGTVVPPNMVKYHTFCDKLLPSSNFSKQVFLENGVPESKLVTVPHGIDVERFITDDVYPLKTNKSKKILLNIATPHKRKNLKNTLRTFGKAFTKDDDVCLIIKANLKKGQHARALVNVEKLLKWFKKEYKNHAEIELVTGFIPNLALLYNACDIVFQMSNLECWWLPGTEALATGKVVVASNWGGHLHYLNSENALLIDGKEVRMPRDFQYWTPSSMAKMFQPNIDDGVEKLRYAVSEYETLVNKFAPNMKATVERFSWDNVANQIVSIME
jgi:glycosyltransferase involved in cell wall biosynthesis